MACEATEDHDAKSDLSTDSHVSSEDRAAVDEFVRTPFAIRRNVVKVWRPIPQNIWMALPSPEDRLLSIHRERWALVIVVLIAALLMGCFSGLGLLEPVDGQNVCVPLLGRTVAQVPEGGADSGWCFVSGKSLSLVFWTVGPSLLSWACLRLVWIPLVASRRENRQAKLTFARHLGCVYLYVYLMVLVGASIMPLLILAGPQSTAFFRWCFWCFLFGETFFVPAVMWGRLILADSTGEVFGRGRGLGLVLYVLLFVVWPIVGMVGEL